MDSQFWKVIGTLFGIGVAISFAKSLRCKKNWREVVSEMIISGFVAMSAGVTLFIWPNASLVAVMAAAAILAILGVAFISEKIEKGLEMAAEKYLKKGE